MPKINVRLRLDPRTLRQLKVHRAALQHIRTVLLLNDRLLRANRLRFSALLSGTGGDRRKYKRSDRLYRQVLLDWERHTGRQVTNSFAAFVEIAAETRQAHAVLKMMSAGMTLNFKPKVIVE